MKCLPGFILLLSVWLLSFPSWAAESSSAQNGGVSTEQSGSGSSSDQSTTDGSGDEEEPDCE